MHAKAGPLWTIDQLSAQVALALSVNYEGQENGQVRDIPDRRTIRYYTTLGLLERPAEMRGRTALYGRRHLLQLVAIKRLQARGLTLADIQQHLLGLPEPALRRLAQLPPQVETALPAEPTAATPAEPAPGRRATAFWSTAPPDVSAQASGSEQDQTAGAKAAPAPEADGIIPFQGVGLGEEVTLLLAASRPIYEDDLSAIRAAAAPLLKLLQRRRLIRPRQERGNP